MIIYLRKNKSSAIAGRVCGVGVRGQLEITMQTARSGKEEGRGGAPGTGAEISLQPVERTMVKQVEPAACGGPL